MAHPLQLPFTRRTVSAFWLASLTVFCAARMHAQAQEAPAKTEAPAAPTAAPAAQAPNDSSEVSTRDSAATFRVRVNLVLVRVVVRDGTGKVIANLQKQDFQLSDNRKPQVISTFSVETP